MGFETVVDLLDSRLGGFPLGRRQPPFPHLQEECGGYQQHCNDDDEHEEGEVLGFCIAIHVDESCVHSNQGESQIANEHVGVNLHHRWAGVKYKNLTQGVSGGYG